MTPLCAAFLAKVVLHIKHAVNGIKKIYTGITINYMHVCTILSRYTFTCLTVKQVSLAAFSIMAVYFWPHPDIPRW